MITRFHVENYKALRDVTLELTPIHVLIGPNDSGKTSIFEALTSLSRTTQTDITSAFGSRWQQGRELVWRGQTDAVRLAVNLKPDESVIDYELACGFANLGRGANWLAEAATLQRNGPTTKFNLRSGNSGYSLVAQIWNNPQADGFPVAKPIHDSLWFHQFYRWVPSLLSLPVAFGVFKRYQMEATGFGLPLVLDDIVREDHKAFAKLETRFREFFPYIDGIKLPREQGFNRWRDETPGSPGVGLYFELANGGDILPAAQASDGLLLVLAYLALLHLPEPPRILLVEEPENGIHPQRLKEILNMLKDLVRGQSRTQVLLTTHSPYVVDCFDPGEVTLCLKNEEGAVTTHRLSESKTVREQIDTFSLGEIWTAEGDEALAGQAVAN
jgi:predicted ATPase